MIQYTFKKMEETVLTGKRQTLVLAAAQSEEALCAVDEAVKAGIVDAVLAGNRAAIQEKAAQSGVDISKYEIVDCSTEAEAAQKSVQLIREGRAQLLMKGLLETSDFLRAVLSSETGIRTNRRLCSVVAMECKALDRIIILADVGTNICPNTEEKANIIENCAIVANALGVETPKAAVLCAHEKVQREAMPVTAEAAILSVMAERGQIGGNPVVDGPISMDLAVNTHAVEVKKYKGKIRGDADILIAPNLEVGNVLVKGLMYLSKDIRVAGVGMGAKVPLILTSRGDDRDTKYYSIVLSVLISQLAEKKGKIQ